MYIPYGFCQVKKMYDHSCKGMVTGKKRRGLRLWWKVVLDQRHLSRSGCNWLQCGIISLIWSPGEGDSQLPPSVFGCLTESPLMLNVMLPGHPMPVACFVKTKKMNINVIQTESCGRERGSSVEGLLGPISGFT